MLITNRLYKEGKYTLEEAAIIVTAFSTVSATSFMIVVAKKPQAYGPMVAFLLGFFSDHVPCHYRTFLSNK
jgi:nucleoside recognition membrane protein YjiH